MYLKSSNIIMIILNKSVLHETKKRIFSTKCEKSTILIIKTPQTMSTDNN